MTQALNCSLYVAQRNISSSVLIFLLWTFLCFNQDFNVCASVWLLYPFTVQKNILRALCQLLRRFLMMAPTDMPKHVGDLLMSDVYILVHVMLVT